MAWIWTHVVPVWVLTALGVVWVGLTVVEDSRVESMVAVLAGSVMASFVLQIIAYRSGGLITRLSMAVTGSTVLTLGASLVFAVISVVD